MIDDLVKRWGGNQTTAIIRAITEAHGSGAVLTENLQPVPYVAEPKLTVIEHPTPEQTETVKAQFPPPRPLPKTFAQRQREDLEERAARAGKCPDCGFVAEYCACGATAC